MLTFILPKPTFSDTIKGLGPTDFLQVYCSSIRNKAKTFGRRDHGNI